MERLLREVGGHGCVTLDVSLTTDLVSQRVRWVRPLVSVVGRLDPQVLPPHRLPGRVTVHRQFTVVVVVLREPPGVGFLLYLDPIRRWYRLPERTRGI